MTLTDADGNTSPMIVQSSAVHALDVQVPAGAALGGAFVTLTSGGAKYFGTLFLDSQDNIPAVNGCTFQSSVSSTPVSSARQHACPFSSSRRPDAAIRSCRRRAS